MWRTDSVIQGDPEAQRVVHAAMYYLLSSLCKDCQWSIPAMTLPSRAYLGRIWWDADTFVFPSILVLHPELARSIVDYRCRDRKSTRLNSSHQIISYAVFCLKKKNRPDRR